MKLISKEWPTVYSSKCNVNKTAFVMVFKLLQADTVNCCDKFGAW